MARRFPLAAIVLVLASAGHAAAQETPSAIATRKKIQQKISVEFKDVTTKGIFEDIKAELDKPVSFKIDTTTGISLNTKLSYSAKSKPVDEILSEMADKFDFGWFVKSDAKDRLDGWIIIRKHKEKERGYEAGKEPKKKAGADALERGLRFLAEATQGDNKVHPAVRRGLEWLRSPNGLKALDSETK